ncbi:glycyl-radical enzyme activating protein [Deltaproteobacteria bacterium TL4]
MTDSALICDIQRFSIHDGPGIRSTIFFKGCPLNCLWCHNPEALDFKNELTFKAKACILCLDCLEACPQSAISADSHHISIDRTQCDACLECTRVCPSKALSPAAKTYLTQELLHEILRDRDYYQEEGGITLSGGEPFAQLKFLKKFLPQVKSTGIHVAVETSGFWSYTKVSPLFEWVDLFLIDVKVVNTERHIELTGKSNRRILENLKRLHAEKNKNQDLWVRMPVIPGINDRQENLEEVCDLLQTMSIHQITLLPYHDLGTEKVEILGKQRPSLNSLASMSNAELEKISQFFTSRKIEVLQA